MNTARAKIDGAALREVTVRDYRRSAERMGLPVDMAAIERLATADCETYGAVTREARPSAPAAPDPAKVDEKSNALQDAVAKETGGEVIDPSQLRTISIPELQNVPKPNERWAWALGRMAVICRGANPMASAPPGATRGEVLRAVLSSCECPALALEFYRLKAHWALYMAGHGRRKIAGFEKVERNVFADLPRRTAVKKYMRLTEDLCDRSAGKLGPWWVPK